MTGTNAPDPPEVPKGTGSGFVLTGAVAGPAPTGARIGTTTGAGGGADPAGAALVPAPAAAPGLTVAPAPGADPASSAPASPAHRVYPRFTGLSKPALVTIIAAVAVGILAAMASGTLTIFFIGILIVYLIDPPIRWMHRHGVPRWMGTIAMLAVVIAGFLLLVALVTHVIVTEGATFAGELPKWIANLQSTVAASNLPDGVKATIDHIGGGAQDTLAGLDWGAILVTGMQTAFGLLGIVFSLTVIPFFVFFVAKDRPALSGAAMRMVPEPWRGDVAEVTSIALSDLGIYIRAQLVIVAVVAVLIFVGLEILSGTIDPAIGSFALFLAVFAGFMELIPNFGPYIGMIPAIVVALTVSPAMVVAVAALFIGVAFIEGQVLVPVIQGRRTALHPGWIMVLILSGMAIAGVLGAIVAVPVALTARDVFAYVFRRAAGEEDPATVSAEGDVAPGAMIGGDTADGGAGTPAAGDATATPAAGDATAIPAAGDATATPAAG
jgi:predicted PurR-regulated permease PerM